MVSVYHCMATTCKWNENKKCEHDADEITIDFGGHCEEYEMNEVEDN